MLAPDRMFFGLVVFSFVRRIDLGSVRTVNSELNCVSITEYGQNKEETCILPPVLFSALERETI